jgi:hypothetical protein
MGLASPPAGARQNAVQDVAQRTGAVIQRRVNNVPGAWQTPAASRVIAAAILAAENPRTAAQVRAVSDQLNTRVTRQVQRALSQRYASPNAAMRGASRATTPRARAASAAPSRGRRQADSIGAVPRSRATRNASLNSFQRGLGNVLQNTGTTRSRRA